MSSDKVKKASLAFGLVATLGGGYLSIEMHRCHSDKDSAEKVLKDEGYSVIAYKGKPGFFPIKNDDYYEDIFTVKSKNGEERAVVVGKTYRGLSQIYAYTR